MSIHPSLSMLSVSKLSREFWWTLARCLGNPIVSLSYTLWTIEIDSKCAFMVDMATKYDDIPGLYDEVAPGQRSQFAQIRDSTKQCI